MKYLNFEWIRNILVHKNHLKISDFGISIITKNDSSRFDVQGTADYMSPEMLNGRKYNSKTDIWFEDKLAIRFQQFMIFFSGH